MPKNNIDYSKTFIYKIVCKDVNIDDLYVGSTTNFIQRKYNHSITCYNKNNRHYKIYLYQFIRDNGGWDNFDMVEIEKYNAIDKNDAHKKERYWIEELQATLNKVIPTRSSKEYEKIRRNKLLRKEYNLNKCKEHYEKNKEKRLKQQKIYQEKNKEKIAETKKIYREKTKK